MGEAFQYALQFEMAHDCQIRRNRMSVKSLSDDATTQKRMVYRKRVKALWLPLNPVGQIPDLYDQRKALGFFNVF